VLQDSTFLAAVFSIGGGITATISGLTIENGNL
jgi:hypothetical protein